MNLSGEYLKVVHQLNLKETTDLLLVSIQDQKMYHQKEAKTVKTYVVSTSLNPPNCLEGSFGTPWGLHEICDVIGKDQPIGMVFQGRLALGQCYWQCDQKARKKNLITSRILRLRGLEEGLNSGGNADSYARFIYVHGTNHEERLGEPSSSGCIQVSNEDAVSLADTIPRGTHLYISLA